MEIYVTQFVLFLLLFTRITSMIVTAPFYGHESVPVQVKVALGGFLAFVFYPLAAASAPVVDLQLLGIALLALKEAAVGLLMGFAVMVIFEGVRAAGELVGFDLGLSIATVFDPDNGLNNAVIGQLFYLVFMLVFFMVDGHHHVLQALQASYHVVPVGGLTLGAPMGEHLIALTGSVFAVAVKIAAPVIVASFLINVAMSVLARVAPQMNVFVISFPVKIGVGLIVLMAAAPMMVYVFRKLLAGFESDILDLVMAM
jgi:flagellar biosynthetic protein FliR